MVDAGPEDADEPETILDEPDVDLDIPEEADVPRPEGESPSCSTENSAEIELSPEPSFVQSVHLAENGSGGSAVIWVQGETSPFDIIMQTFDTAMSPHGDPLVVAADRPHASDVRIIWSHDTWVVVWREAINHEACDDEESCTRYLKISRLDPDGTTLTPPTSIWESHEAFSRPELVASENDVWVLFNSTTELVSHTFVGRLDSMGRTVGDVVDAIPNETTREEAPAAAIVDDVIIIVASLASGGLISTAINLDSNEVVQGPQVLVSNRSASTPTVASTGDAMGLIYTAIHPDNTNSRLLFEEIASDLTSRARPLDISIGSIWPKHPQLGQVGPGWVASWVDGRRDDNTNCVTHAFCRNDIYFVPFSIAGISDDFAPFLLSDDPNDCSSPNLTVSQGRVAAAWLTLRGSRPTAMTRSVACE